MKKLMKSLMLFAAAAMALTSCENEAMNEGIEANDTYTMNFVAGAPESKTSVSIDGTSATFSWDAEDDAEDFVFIQHNEKITLGTDVTFKNNGETATISATFTGDAETEYNHVAVYPASAWIDGTDVESSNFNKAKLNIKANQNLIEGKYDPTADLMVSQNVACVPTDVPQELRFTRLVSVAEMNIKNLAVAAGEKITSVSFAVSETILAGRSYFDLATGEVNEYAYYGASNTITLDNVDGIAANNSSVKVYFTCIPATVAAGETYTVTVTTDKAKYTKSATLSKDLAFEAGKVKAFGVNMEGVVGESINDLSGKYFIVAAKNGNYWGMMYDTTQNYRAATNSGISTYTDYTSFSTFTNEYVWNVEKVDGGNTYTISNYDNSKYLQTVTTNASGSNYAYVTDDVEKAEQLSLTQNNNGSYEIKATSNTNGRILAFNTNDGQERFAFYLGTQNKELYLVPVTGAIKSNLAMTFSESALNLEVGDAVTLPTLSFNPAGTYAVTYSVNNTEGNVASVAGNVVSISTAAAGTATVTASFAGNDNFKPAIASYTVTVKEKSQGGGESHEENATLTMKTIFNDTATNLSNGTTYTWGDFEVTFTKKNNSNTNYNASDDGIRWYKSDILTFAHKDGYNITKIVFTATQLDGNPTADSGSISVLNKVVTWTGKAASVAITAAGGQIRFKSIDITYEVSGGSTEPETPDQPGEGGDEPETPTEEQTVEMNIYGSTGTKASDSSYITWTSGDVTFTNTKGSNAIRTSDTDHYRVYGNGKMTISVAEGTISKVVITCASGYESVMETSFKNAGYTVSKNGTVVTVAGSGSSFTATASAQTRLSKIAVTYSK